VDAVNPRISAFSVVMHEQALAAAEESQARLRAQYAGPLEGGSVAIKDAFDHAGQETSTCRRASSCFWRSSSKAL